MTARGLFVTLEGGEGVGKSTLARAMAQALEARGVATLTTREPGGAPGAEEIRALLVSGSADRWDAVAEALLMTAARRDHVRRTIRPALERGALVLCDRYVDSTRAYQGLRGADRALIDRLHDETVGLDPALTLVLDAPVETGLARARARGGDDRYESMGRAYHAALREAFLDIASAAPERCVRIDAARAPDAVLRDALAALEPRLAPAP